MSRDRMPPSRMKIETLAVHAGHFDDLNAGSIAPPIYPSTTFERDEDGSYPLDHVYSRESNLNRGALEECLAALEGGTQCAAFSSGMAAANALFQTLSPGDHIVAPEVGYYQIRQLLRDTFMRWGLEVSFVDMADLSAVEEAMRPNTKLLWIETPANPMMSITDIAATASIAHAGGARLICDNTFATPLLQRPLDLGADLVLHSTTKYLNGHSDVLGGALVTRGDAEAFRPVRSIQKMAGAVSSPFDCWLTLRGIRTLPLRMRTQSESAMRVAEFLNSHSQVESVHYPGLEQHPGHEIAAGQMKSYGGMLSFQVRGGEADAVAVAARVRLFTRATSLGGVHSLIEHRASIEAHGSTTPRNLLRLSIGLEHVDDLIEDLEVSMGDGGEGERVGG